MRWQGQSVDEDRERRLPNLNADVIRTFDAPEAVGIRFHEVRAKSALNRVPKQSRMPFPWTVNPYRGCSHACVWCAHGDTAILLADGCTKRLADLKLGDTVYGTVRRGRYRRYQPTAVLAHWSARKAAFRITLEDGTELITSGDHRFLTNRGWKFVEGTEWGGPLQRPHLTLNNTLMGTGWLADAPSHTYDYKDGYLCGLIRGDGHIGVILQPRANRRTYGLTQSFRLALTDLEALRRAREYLAGLEIATQEWDFAVAHLGHRPMRAISTSIFDRVQEIRRAIFWPPRTPTSGWMKGFLAGIFDAEGSFGQVIRICNTDAEIIDWITYCLRQLGFSHVVEDRKQANGLKVVRLVGGLTQQLRFFHTTDPAITRKRSIEGTAIKNPRPDQLRVAEIEPLGKRLELFDITTGTGDFIANGVVSHNCFARPTHTYLDLNAREDFEREIVVKVNVPEVLRAELGRKSWKREHVALGTNTDPYQWVESKYRLMPGIWKALRDSETPASLVSKSPLVLRDLEVLQELNERSEMSVYMSVPTLDEGAWRATEPHTPSPRARIKAVAALNDAGIPAGVLIAPLMPGINDSPEEVHKIRDLAIEAGAISVGAVTLHLRGEVRDIWFDWLQLHRPDLIPMYEEMYPRGAYARSEIRNRHAELAKFQRAKPRRGLRAAPKSSSTEGGDPQAALF